MNKFEARRVLTQLCSKMPFDDAARARAEDAFAAGGEATHAGNNGTTLLHAAASHGNIRYCILLIAHGAVVDAQKETGETPLQEACEGHHFAVCELLLEHNARVDLKDTDGYTALHYAAWVMSAEICGLVLEHGADVHAENAAGNTPLLTGSRGLSEPVCEGLLEAGSDPRHRNRKGQCASDMGFVRNILEKMRRQVLLYFEPEGGAWFPAQRPPHRGRFQQHALYACVTGQFPDVIMQPLLNTGKAEDLALLKRIYDALPQYWQEQYQQVLVELERAKKEESSALLLKEAKSEGLHAATVRRPRGPRERT